MRVLFALSLIVACGSSTERPRDGRAARRVEAPGPGAAMYSTRATDHAVRGGIGASDVEAAITEAASAAGMVLQGDGRLGTLAAWIGGEMGEGDETPPHEVIEFFTRHLGIVEPVPHVLVLGHSDRAALQSSVRAAMERFLARQGYDHYGAAVIQRDDMLLAIITVSSRALDLTDLPRQASAGSVRIEGALHEGFTQPVFVVTTPNGATDRMPAGSGPGFQFNLPAPTDGAYRVEILAESPRGITVVANVPLWVGVAPPEFVELGAEQGPGEARDATRVAEALFAELNATRAQAGLSPLERMPRLDDVARAHSEDMKTNGYVGHTSPTTGGAPERVVAAGIRSGLVLENIGRGYGATEIHRGLVESPGHRANITNPQVTHVGIGVVSEMDGDRLAFIATEVYIRTNSRIDPAAGAERLLQAINEARQARGAPPVEAEPNLQQAASEAATAYFADPNLTQQDAVDQASGAMRRFAIAFRRVGGLMTVVGDLTDAERLEPTFDPEVRYIGIGVAQGNRPDAPPNSIGVVIMLGWPR